MRKARALVVLFLTFSCLSNVAKADLIGLLPDIQVDGCYISYDADMHIFSVAYGWPGKIAYPGSPPAEYGFADSPEPSCDVSIAVDNDGTLIGSGTGANDLAITGLIDKPGKIAGDVLLGQIVSFDYDYESPVAIFTLVFSVTGGSEAAAFGGEVTMLLTSKDSNFAGGVDFSGDFDNSNSINDQADVFATPEPATMLLLLAGGGAFGWRRWRR